MALLILSEIIKSFASPGGSGGRDVLRNLNLELDRGQSAAIVGPSGCGKTTLLNLIGGLDQPTSGSVTWDGMDLANMSPQDLAAMRARDIGFVFQSHFLLPQCSALENVLVPSLVCEERSLRSTARERATQMLERVGLGEHLDHSPSELSGGEAQRVAVVRALINQPRLLLADEPTGSLDEESAAALGALLVEMHDQLGMAMLVATHSSDLASQFQTQMSLTGGQLRIVAPTS